MDPITLVTAGVGVVKGLKAILPFFGSKSQKVAEAIDVIDEAVGDVKAGKLPPEAQVELKKLDVDELRILASDQADARSTIRAESQSQDPFVRRARPTFLYLMYVILGVNYVLVPLINLIFEASHSPVSFPAELYWLFGSSYLGYGYLRTSDKKGSFNPLKWMGGK